MSRLPDDITYNRHHGNAESIAANDAIATKKPHSRQRVLQVIRDRGAYGATSEEIAMWLECPVHTISGRITELKTQGHITASDLTRPTRSGNAARVLVAVPEPVVKPVQTGLELPTDAINQTLARMRGRD